VNGSTVPGLTFWAERTIILKIESDLLLAKSNSHLLKILYLHTGTSF